MTNWQGTFGLILNAALAAVAVATLYVIWLQTKATQLSAEAARTNADALITAERAWLLIAPTEWNPKMETLGSAAQTQFQKFPVAVKNVGKTPAHISAFAMRYLVLNSLSELQDEPDYPSPTLYSGRLLVPQDSYAETVCLEGWEQSKLGELSQLLSFQKKLLYAYGFIKYKDDFGKDHETRVGYAFEYFHVNMALRPSFKKRQAGPPLYNRAT
jgi:hypothetical protein